MAKKSRGAPENTGKLTLNADELALVEASDRFCADHPDSAHWSNARYQAASILYRANHLDEAIQRFRSIALASRFDPEVCDISAGLWMDALNVKGDHGALAGMLGEYRASPCSKTRTPAPIRVPRFKGVPSPDGKYPQLDALTFLDGCWSYWSVDWGYTLCFRRDGFEWLGEYESRGALEPVERVGLLLSQDERGVVFRSGKPVVGRFTEGRLASAGPGWAVFVEGPGTLEFRRDLQTGELQLKDDGHVYRLKPVHGGKAVP